MYSYIGHEFFGILCYADDVTLLAPTASALQKMVHTCEEFGADFDVRYNPKKTMCIQLGGPQVLPHPDIALYSQNLQWCEVVKHLGNMVSSDLKDENDIKKKKADFIVRTNTILANFRAISVKARTVLFISKCCSFYGSQIWSLHSKCIDELEVCWRKATRRLLGLPNTTRSVLLPYLLNCDNLKVQLSRRFFKLLQTIVRGKNRKAIWIVKHGARTGTVQRNIAYLAKTFQMTDKQILSGLGRLRRNPRQPEYMQRAGAVLDFMDLFISHDDKDNLNEILNYLCTY